MAKSAPCTHTIHIHEDVKPKTDGCEECLASGGKWVQLRMCLSCGHVGCCDSSKGKHATAHFNQTQHPIMRSAEKGDKWMWCYLDEVMFEEA